MSRDDLCLVCLATRRRDYDLSRIKCKAVVDRCRVGFADRPYLREPGDVGLEPALDVLSKDDVKFLGEDHLYGTKMRRKDKSPA